MIRQEIRSSSFNRPASSADRAKWLRAAPILLARRHDGQRQQMEQREMVIRAGVDLS
jgi:hypothetical protein